MTRASDTARLIGAGATINDGTTITTADNTAQLTLQSTDADSGIGPHQVFYRNSASPADADLLAELDFRGRNDNSQDVDYVVMNVKANDVTDGEEDGEFILQVATAGSTDTTMHVKPSEIVFNEDGIDRDFRVEGDSESDALFVDAANNNVVFGGTGNINGAKHQIVADGAQALSLMQNNASAGNQNMLDLVNTANAGASQGVRFHANGYGTIVGTIGWNTSSTSYNTSSDYRLKENVNYSWDGTALLKQLKPAKFNFKVSPDTTVDGFMAHEVSSVVPHAVTNKKDDKNDDGTPLYQTMDSSKLVPLLTKSLQEALARIDTLEAEVAKLKG